MNFVLGSRGRLGQAIALSFAPDQMTTLARSDYADWWRDDSADAVSRFFEPWSNTQSVVYVAAGLIDPKKPVNDHHCVNFILARNVIQGLAKVGLRTVTFGTVMEKIIGDSPTNPYVSSKAKLGNFVSEFSMRSKLALHIRIHTLYGGNVPESFMFLGQLFESIISQTPFKMSPGTQLREYHHIDDEVAAIATLVTSKTNGVLDLSHGDPVTLRDLATFIFEAFNCADLLKVGALPGPSSDNYSMLFERLPALRTTSFRDTLPSVVEYLRLCKSSLGVKNEA